MRISGWENFPSEDQCTENSQSASIRGHNFASESHYPKYPGGHSLIKMTGGGPDTDVITWSGHSS